MHFDAFLDDGNGGRKEGIGCREVGRTRTECSETRRRFYEQREKGATGNSTIGEAKRTELTQKWTDSRRRRRQHKHRLTECTIPSPQPPRVGWRRFSSNSGSRMDGGCAEGEGADDWKVRK